MVVEKLGKIEGVRRLCPVAEHNGHRRQHLHIHGSGCTLFRSACRIPQVRFHFTEKLLTLQHPGAVGPVVLETDKLTVAVPLL
jgi:hypothetical protein